MARYNQFAFHGKEGIPSQSFPQFAPQVIHIKSALLPNSFYSVIDGSGFGVGWFDNSKFYIDEGLGAHIVTITDGYYADMSDFTDAVRVALNAVARPGQTYSVSYSTDNHKITITGSSFNFDLQFSTIGGQEITTMLGFTKSDTGLAISHTGTLFAQLLSFSSIGLSISELEGFEKSKMNGNLTLISRMHAIFPIIGSNAGYSRYFINNMFQITIGINGRSITQITPHLYVIDSNNEFKKIGLNGIPFTLQIDWE